jgi:hypothetical protein
MISHINNYHKIYTYLKTSNKKNKNLILEPICTIIKIILLSYKSSGTKIYIYKNSILYHDYTILQGIYRLWSGDSRDDLHNLYNPLIKSLYYFERDNPIHIFLLNKCNEGLFNLTKVYDKNTIINHTILHYINIINKFIDKNIIDNPIMDIESPLIDGLKKIWKDEEIELIYKMLLHIDSKDETNEKNIYLKNIEDIITFKENEVYNYIEKNSTTYN